MVRPFVSAVGLVFSVGTASASTPDPDHGATAIEEAPGATTYVRTSLPIFAMGWPISVVATISVGGESASVAETCVFVDARVSCPTLGDTAVALEEDLGAERIYKLKLRDLDGATITDISTPAWGNDCGYLVNQSKSAGWLWWEHCVEEPDDDGECDTWCKNEGYVSGSCTGTPGPFFGSLCDVLECTCAKHDGTTEIRTINEDLTIE